MINTGTIILKRKTQNFSATFCFVTADILVNDNPISMLHNNERIYYDSLKSEIRKKSYLLGRTASKKAISHLVPVAAYNNIFISSGIFGFPVVKYHGNSNIQTSISHCDNIAVSLAFPEEHPLGIDIELIDSENIESIMAHTSINELLLISNCKLAPAVGITMLWTIKEALSKILKTGFTIDLKLLEILSLENSGLFYTSNYVNFSQYKAISMCTNQHICSIAMPKNTDAELQSLVVSFIACLKNNSNT